MSALICDAHVELHERRAAEFTVSIEGQHIDLCLDCYLAHERFLESEERAARVARGERTWAPRVPDDQLIYLLDVDRRSLIGVERIS